MYIKIDNNIALAAERNMAASKIPYLSISAEGALRDVATLDAAHLSKPSGTLAIGYKDEVIQVEGRVATQVPAQGVDLSKLPSSRSGVSFGFELAAAPYKNFTFNMGIYGSANYLNLDPPTVETHIGITDFVILEGGLDTEYLEVVGLKTTANPLFGQLIANPLMGGIEAFYTIPLGKKLDLIPFLGLEIIQKITHYSVSQFTTTPVEFELGVGADLIRALEYNWDDEPSKEKEVHMGEAFSDWTGVSRPYVDSQGATLYLGYTGDFTQLGAGVAQGLNMKLTGFDNLGKNSLLPYVGIGIMGILNDMIHPSTINGGFGLFVNTDVIDKMMPFIYTNLWISNSPDTASQVKHYNIAAGMEFSIMTNTLMILKYTSGNLLRTGTNRFGDVQFQVKLTYK